MLLIVVWLMFLVAWFSVAFADSQPVSITTSLNGLCIESSHIWTNDCLKAFDNITNASNLFQTSTGSQYVGYSFYSEKQVVRYWVINSNNDINSNMTAFHFEAYVSGAWVTLDTKNPYTVVSGKWVYTEIVSPVYSSIYRLVIDTGGTLDTRISEIQMFDATSIAEQDQFFTEDQILEIAIAEMVWLLMFSIIAFALNLKNIV